MRKALLTFTIIGAGPTGVELAGMIAELAHDTLPREFRHINTRETRVILVEAGPRILAGFTERLSSYAHKALEKLGVEIRTGKPVVDCTTDGVTIADQLVPSHTLIWAAGVEASPAAKWLDMPSDRAGRAIVEKDLTVPDDSSVFVIGDTASITQADGAPVPGIAPAAKQQGAYVAKVIRNRLQGKAPPAPFRYRHQGNLATIGNRAAIIDFGWIKLKGELAWWIWGLAHIYFLIGNRSRLAVAWSWLWIFVSGQHSARLITQKELSGEQGHPRARRAGSEQLHLLQAPPRTPGG